jgi:signal transduction histidine kinase
MSIYSRIFLPFVLALAAGAVIAWWLATTLMADSLARRLDDQLGRAVAELASGRLPLSDELLDRLGSLLGAEVVLIPPASGGIPTPTLALAAAALRTLGQSPAGGAGRFQRGDTSYSLVVRPIDAKLDPRYRALAAATALTEIDQVSQRVARLLGGAALAGTLLLAWVAHRTARGITHPLREIGTLAGRLATGDLQARARIAGAEELVELGRAIEQMAEQLARYQAQIAERNRLSALGELAARVAHEVRNPLTAIKLHVELLAEQAADPADRRSLDAILNEINRLELVVATTLSLGRPAGADRVTGDLNTLVQEVAALLGPQLAHRRILLECHLQALAPVPLDGDRIKQVLLNLVTNAADALPAGGVIRVATGTDPDGGGVLLTVEDSGPGVAPERRPALIEPDDAESGRSDKPHGLGLGLRISHEIAVQHGGSLRIESSTALGGARFALHLPCPASAPLAAEPQ